VGAVGGWSAPGGPDGGDIAAIIAYQFIEVTNPWILEPGYGRILIAPRPGGDLTWADVSLETPHGHAAVRWELADGELHVRTEVPAGAEATLRLPGRDDEVLAPGVHERVASHVASVAALETA
jgi:hypothetical protein